METKTKLLYALEDKPPRGQAVLYGVQWAIFIYSLNLLYPLVIGDLFGMTQVETAALLQRSTFLVGFTSMLQIIFGHRLPLIEGVAALWFSIFILFAQTASLLGSDTGILLRELAFGLILVGIIVFLLSYLGLLDWLQKLFTPIVTGCTLILICLQVSGSFIKGMLGYEGSQINGWVALLSVGLAGLVIFLSFKGNKLVKSFSVLIGMVAGWALYNLLGLPIEASGQEAALEQLIYLPQLFPWGTPIATGSMIITAVISALVLISNQVASIAAMKDTVADELPVDTAKRCGIINGLSNLLSGCFGGIGTTPLANSAGFVKLTGVGARTPFLIGSLLIMLIGVIWPLGQFFTLIPSSVAYAVAFVPYSQMIGIGMSNLASVELGQKNLLIIGLTLLAGVGLMFVSPTAYINMPLIVQTIVSNGLLMGIILVLLLEHVVFREVK